jgi:hypothetical protein
MQRKSLLHAARLGTPLATVVGAPQHIAACTPRLAARTACPYCMPTWRLMPEWRERVRYSLGGPKMYASACLRPNGTPALTRSQTRCQGLTPSLPCGYAVCWAWCRGVSRGASCHWRGLEAWCLDAGGGLGRPSGPAGALGLASTLTQKLLEYRPGNPQPAPPAYSPMTSDRTRWSWS